MGEDLSVFTDRGVDIPESLHSMALAAELIVDPVEALCPFSRPFCLRRLELLDGFVMATSLLLNARASQR